ncbi:MAG TPA: hypothetical protein VMP01_00330 [Pirellulaceae bacterium]|nr:hypothetical protein [Pirellulaceae bacterium]
MLGTVDAFDRPLVTVEIRAPGAPVFHSITAWIDTGCTGHLVLPRALVHLLGLPRVGRLKARMADGRESSVTTFVAEANWLASVDKVEVIQSSSDSALMGLCMLHGTDLRINFALRQLEINRPPPEN